MRSPLASSRFTELELVVSIYPKLFSSNWQALHNRGLCFTYEFVVVRNSASRTIHPSNDATYVDKWRHLVMYARLNPAKQEMDA